MIESAKQRWFDAERAGERYASLAHGMNGLYAEALGSVDPTSPKARSDLRIAIYQLAQSFVAGEQAFIDDGLTVAAHQGLADALEALGLGETTAPDLPEPVSELLSATGEHLRAEIVMQIERDVLAVEKRLRDLALKVNVMTRASDISKRAAIIRAQIKDRGSVEFSFVDRAGRRWPSQRYISTVWRQHLLNVHVETTLHVFAERGAQAVEVVHPDPKSAKNGLMFGLVGQHDLPGLDEIRDDVFHPNSQVWLRPL
ncbi:hypothetical protein [Magnetospirillum molischianum]|uniref:Uncharacterized protein n=1 Tax=Magnetospirillum molischianum DSM 120 TaxID=1150626 RepID=H8FY51_MAGML|nr:hypothetical protein [Magnetospirillum molischianum]CCG43289.1 hypothetical protein PHAMO_80080 [Magnetospirillum molischianum DSM 120]